MHFDPNNLFYKMGLAYSEAKKKGEKLTICNEGGSRAGKTFDTFALIVAICADNVSSELDIYILRDTLSNCKDYTYKDFVKFVKICDIPVFFSNPQKPNCKLYGNNIYFRGLDDEKNTEGFPSDIIFVNEVLETKQTKVEGLQMRCRLLEIYDWNPKLTKHWIFEYEGRPDVLFTKTTYKDNKHLEETIVRKIESYNPEIEINVKNKTANPFRWKVYGLGLRADREGNVFNDSQLNKFDIEDIEEHLKNPIIIAWCDVADQGIDYVCFPVGLLIGEKTYVLDMIFTPKDSAYSIPLIIQMLIKHDIHRAIFESNNHGLAYLKGLWKSLKIMDLENEKENPENRTELFEKWKRRTDAVPNSSNKHSRIVVQADTNIIENFYFLRHRTGMYAEYYDYLTMYKHDKSVKQDDAPDATAGLSILSQKYN